MGKGSNAACGMIFRHDLGVRIKEIIRNENNSSCRQKLGNWKR